MVWSWIKLHLCKTAACNYAPKFEVRHRLVIRGRMKPPIQSLIRGLISYIKSAKLIRAITFLESPWQQLGLLEIFYIVPAYFRDFCSTLSHYSIQISVTKSRRYSPTGSKIIWYMTGLLYFAVILCLSIFTYPSWLLYMHWQNNCPNASEMILQNTGNLNTKITKMPMELFM